MTRRIGLSNIGDHASSPRACFSPSQHGGLVDEAAFGEARQIEGLGVDQVGVAVQDQICQDLAGGG